MRNVVFYGNGINFLSKNSISWHELLIDLMNQNPFSINQTPNLLVYERIRLDWNRNNIQLNISIPSPIKIQIAKKLDKQESNAHYKKLLELPIDNYLTTNYDYALNKSLSDFDEKTLVTHKATEDIYSIRRHLTLKKNSDIKKVWHIHGEIQYPKSIMLGINHYCGSVGKMDGYLKGTYFFKHDGIKQNVKSIEEKIKTNSFDNYSWIELFFNSNIHIAGFGFDFGEIDLWWVLNRRARLVEQGKINNKVFYYTKPLNTVSDNKIIENNKRETLKAFHVEVIEVPLEKRNYHKHWDHIIELIKEKS